MHEHVGRRAFTLIEMLVIIAILAVLMALLLPAVQNAREAARRTQCANNLRQVAIALQAYAASEQVFPYGVLDEMSTDIRKRDTWMQQTWPFLEQMTLFQQYTAWRGAWVMDAPPVVKDAVIGTFLCPSDPKAPGFGGGGHHRSGGYGFQGNYVGCATDEYIEVSRTHLGYQLVVHDGIFYGNSNTPPAAIRDGLSNTLLLSEVRIRGVGGGLPASPAAFGDWWGDGGGYWGGGQHASFGFSTMETPNSTVSDRTFACKPAEGNEPRCISVGDSYQKLIVARSLHTAGVNVSMADTSTRFVSDMVAPVVWRALATRAGGDAASLE